MSLRKEKKREIINTKKKPRQTAFAKVVEDPECAPANDEVLRAQADELFGKTTSLYQLESVLLSWDDCGNEKELHLLLIKINDWLAQMPPGAYAEQRQVKYVN